MAGQCGVSVSVYNVNLWILNVHLQFSVVVPLIFALKVQTAALLVCLPLTAVSFILFSSFIPSW